MRSARWEGPGRDAPALTRPARRSIRCEDRDQHARALTRPRGTLVQATRGSPRGNRDEVGAT